MDCPAEESEIRRAVEHIEAIGGLRFDLSARTLRIDAPEDALPTIIDAIRKAGFATELVKPGTPVGKDRDGIPVASLFLRWRSLWRWVQSSWLT
jgi:Cd2+/Zn2+-exporting ATPase